jgi:hypothetical protein
VVSPYTRPDSLKSSLLSVVISRNINTTYLTLY